MMHVYYDYHYYYFVSVTSYTRVVTSSWNKWGYLKKGRCTFVWLLHHLFLQMQVMLLEARCNCARQGNVCEPSSQNLSLFFLFFFFFFTYVYLFWMHANKCELFAFISPFISPSPAITHVLLTQLLVTYILCAPRYKCYSH